WHKPLPTFPFFSSTSRRPPVSTLFPYTTLFRSHRAGSSSRLQALREVDFDEIPVSSAQLRKWIERLDDARPLRPAAAGAACKGRDRKSTRLNSSHVAISYAVFCLKKKKNSNKPH